MEKKYEITITLKLEREMPAESKAAAKLMAIEDYYDDLMHCRLPEPKVEVKLKGGRK